MQNSYCWNLIENHATHLESAWGKIMKSGFGYMMKWQVAANSAHAPDIVVECWQSVSYWKFIYQSIWLLIWYTHYANARRRRGSHFDVGPKGVPDMCQVPEPSYDSQMATTATETVTVTETAPDDDDDEWVLIVYYKSSACSDLGFSFSGLGRVWMMSAQLWRIITRFSCGSWAWVWA